VQADYGTDLRRQQRLGSFVRDKPHDHAARGTRAPGTQRRRSADFPVAAVKAVACLRPTHAAGRAAGS
jgi:hypothetical protein